MRVLAIECSTLWLAVAAGDETGFREYREHAVQAHSQRVLPLVQTALAECGWSLSQLDGVAFGAGPGSFTGVRIACGVAQGLALGAGLLVVPVATLEALAEDAWRMHGATRVFACLDARMREVYIGAYQRVDDAWHEALAPDVRKPADIVWPPGTWFGAGEGFAAYPELAGRPALDGIDATLVPSASSVARLAIAALTHGRGVPPEDALPRYVRHRVALTTLERAQGAVL